MRCIWIDPSHFSLSLAFIPFMWWCKFIRIPTTELLEKAWLSFQLVTFWDLNIFIRKAVKNARAFCCYPVIYLSSPDCLDPVQLSLGHAWGKYLSIDARTAPCNWSPVSSACCNHLQAKRIGMYGQSAFAWKVLDSVVSSWTKFHFMSRSNHRVAW